jgi:hypothetical protein
MKSKSVKYAEATKRNMRNFTPLAGYTLEQVKHRLGIHQTDTSFDAELKRLIEEMSE